MIGKHDPLLPCESTGPSKSLANSGPIIELGQLHPSNCRAVRVHCLHCLHSHLQHLLQPRRHDPFPMTEPLDEATDALNALAISDSIAGLDLLPRVGQLVPLKTKDEVRAALETFDAYVVGVPEKSAGAVLKYVPWAWSFFHLI
jgi:hypothetical protein